MDDKKTSTLSVSYTPNKMILNSQTTFARDLGILRLRGTHYKTPIATRTEITCTLQGQGNERLYSLASQSHTIFLYCDKNPAMKNNFDTK
jgi:hypothetical protein